MLHQRLYNYHLEMGFELAQSDFRTQLVSTKLCFLPEWKCFLRTGDRRGQASPPLMHVHTLRKAHRKWLQRSPASSSSIMLSSSVLPYTALSLSNRSCRNSHTAAFQSQGCFSGTSEIRCMYVDTGPTQWFATLAGRQIHLESF